MSNTHLTIGEIIAFLEDDRNIKDKSLFFNHIDECQSCFKQYVRLSAPIDSYEDYEMEEMPEKIKDKLYQQLGIDREGSDQNELNEIQDWPLGKPDISKIPKMPLGDAGKSVINKWSYFLAATALIIIFLLPPVQWQLLELRSETSYRSTDKSFDNNKPVLGGDFSLNKKGLFSYRSDYPNKYLSIRSKKGEEYFMSELTGQDGKINLNKSLADIQISSNDTLQLVIKSNRMIIYEGLVTKKK
jgi:hypothetical protein